MQANIKIKMNPVNKIIKDHGLERGGPVNRFLRDTVERLSDPYIPMSSSSGVHMKNQKTYPNNHSIKYIAPYAHYHYKGKKAIGPSRPEGVTRTISGINMKYQGAPKRGPEWEKRMMNDKRKQVCKDVERFIKTGGKQ